jgi:cell division septum initiation protein DivIVA
MTVKSITPKNAQRANQKLKSQLSHAQELKQNLNHQFKAYRDNAEELMTSYVSQVRRLTETTANNNVKITELEQQVANQYKENAELRQDLATVKGHNRAHVETIDLLRYDNFDLTDELTSVLIKLELASTSSWSRAWNRFARWANQS